MPSVLSIVMVPRNCRTRTRMPGRPDASVWQGLPSWYRR
jgi:hypothetical protein